MKTTIVDKDGVVLREIIRPDTVNDIIIENTKKLTDEEKAQLTKEHNKYKNMPIEHPLKPGQTRMGPPNNRIIPQEQMNRKDCKHIRVTSRTEFLSTVDDSNIYDKDGNYLLEIIQELESEPCLKRN